MAIYPSYDLVIRSREGIVFQGKILSLSSVNDKGKFDILAEHANFISLIQKEIVVVKENGENLKLTIDGALLRFKKNKAEVYLGVEAGIKQETSIISK